MTGPITNLGTRVDLQLRQGADFATTLTFTNPDGSPVDLTGSMLVARIRKRPLDTVDVASFTIAIPSPASGVAVLTINAVTTATIPCGNSVLDDMSRYGWLLTFTDSIGLVSTPLYGDLRVAPGGDA